MGKAIIYLYKISSYLNRVVAFFLSIILVLLIAILIYEVYSRYFHMQPTKWVYEASRMTFGFIAIWGGGYALLKGDHIKIDLFYSHWSGGFKKSIDVFNFIFFCIYIGFLTSIVFSDAVKLIGLREHSNSTLGQPLYHWRFALVLGLIFLLLQGIADFLVNIFSLEEKDANDI